MTKYVRNTLTGDLAPVNAELEKIQNSLATKLDRIPSSGEPNQLRTDIDVNSHRIINLGAPINPSDAARLRDVQVTVEIGEDAVSVLDTFSELTQLTPDDSAKYFRCVERGNAFYILQPEGYVALEGDVTFNNSRVAQLQLGITPVASFFGAKGDGSTDDTTALQSGLTRCAGNNLYLEKGNYVVTSALVVNGGLIGTGVQDPDPDFTDEGTVLSTTTNTTILDVGRGSHVYGITFYYPDQVSTSSTPITYPPTIITRNTQNAISIIFDNLRFTNAFQCFRLGDTSGTQSSGRLILNRIYAYAVYNFIETYNILDLINVTDVFVSSGVFNASSSALAEWTQDNGVAILASGDNLETISLSEGIIYGYRIGVYAPSLTSNFSLCKFSNFLFDAVTIGVDISGTTRGTNILFMGCQFIASDPFTGKTSDYQIRISGTGGGDGVVDFKNCTFQAAKKRCVVVDGTGFQSITFTGCRFYNWGALSGLTGTWDAVALNDTDLRVVISGCVFQNTYSDGIGVNCLNSNKVIISSSDFNGCWRAINCTSGTTSYLSLTGFVITNTIDTNSVVTTIANNPQFISAGNLTDKAFLRT